MTIANVLYLVAACLSPSVTASAQVTAADAPDALYTTINLARRGKLDVVLSKVVKNVDLVTEVTEELPNFAGDECSTSVNVNPFTTEGFVLTFPSGSTPNYPELVQTTLTHALENLAYAFPPELWGSSPWSINFDIGNIGYLLWSTSTEVGCGVTSCTKGFNLVLCRFKPTAAIMEQPFSENFFGALKARTTSLVDMKPADVGSGATSTFPSLLVGSFLAVLAVA